LLCFDQVEFLTGFTFCTYVDLMPMNITQHAHWPLYGDNRFYVMLDMVDAITFKAEFDDKGKLKMESEGNSFEFSIYL
jgi:hypothetical protein